MKIPQDSIQHAKSLRTRIKLCPEMFVFWPRDTRTMRKINCEDSLEKYGQILKISSLESKY